MEKKQKCPHCRSKDISFLDSELLECLRCGTIFFIAEDKSLTKIEEMKL